MTSNSLNWLCKHLLKIWSTITRKIFMWMIGIIKELLNWMVTLPIPFQFKSNHFWWHIKVNHQQLDSRNHDLSPQSHLWLETPKPFVKFSLATNRWSFVSIANVCCEISWSSHSVNTIVWILQVGRKVFQIASFWQTQCNFFPFATTHFVYMNELKKVHRQIFSLWHSTMTFILF